MKQYYYILMVILGLSVVGCSDKYDDSSLWEAIDNVNHRVDALDVVMKAYQNKLFVEKVEDTGEGYIITFSDGTKATIVNNKPLDPSELPEDKDTCYLDRIEANDKEVHFYLSDGSDFAIKFVASIDIIFEDASPITVIAGQKRTLNFTVESDIEDVEIEVISSGDLKARIVSFDKATKSGQIEIVVGDSVDEYSKVVLIANNGRRIDMKRMQFTDEGLGIYDNNHKEAKSDGSDIELEFVSDVPTRVIIPDDAQSWVSVVPASRSAEYNSVSIRLEPNFGSARKTNVTIQSTDDKMSIVFHIEQDKGYLGADADEEAAVRAIFESYSGSDLNWDKNSPLFTWPGVKLEDGHVVGLYLVWHNKATKPLPAELGALKHLKDLDLGNCDFSLVPEELGMLTDLDSLKMVRHDWGNTADICEIPACIFNLKGLKGLWLQNYNIPSIDARIAQLEKLESLVLEGDELGSIDFNAICKLMNLRKLKISLNGDLMGGIPEEIGNLRNLEEFNLWYSSFSGDIPESFWSLDKMKHLCIAGNKFNTIKLSDTFIKMKNLESLIMDDIPLIGALPSDIGSLKKLKHLQLESCQLSGEIPTSIVECSSLEVLDLFNNNLTGEIPTKISNLPLKRLYLAKNKLTGSIPEGLGKLEYLLIAQNKLSGSVPDDLLESDVWRNGFCRIIYDNDIEYNFNKPFKGPVSLDMFDDTATTVRYDINTEYAKHQYTILFAMNSGCPHLDAALDMIKKIYEKYPAEKVGIIGRTFSEESDIVEKYDIKWKMYYSQQLDYPGYMTPAITVFDRDGYVVFSDQLQDRFTLPDFLENNM